MFSQGYLDQVHREATRAAAKSDPRREMRGGDGRHVRAIPFALYANAVKAHGVSPRDEEYWRDMDRLYPQYRTKHAGPLRVAVGGQRSEVGGRKTEEKPRGCVTRFGKGRRFVYREGPDGFVRIEV